MLKSIQLKITSLLESEEENELNNHKTLLQSSVIL